MLPFCNFQFPVELNQPSWKVAAGPNTLSVHCEQYQGRREFGCRQAFSMPLGSADAKSCGKCQSCRRTRTRSRCGGGIRIGKRRGRRGKLHEECLVQGKVVQLGIEMGRELQRSDTDYQSLTEWLNPTATPTTDELQASSLYQHVLAPPLERIAEVQEMLVLREEVEEPNRVIGPTSHIGPVLEEAHQGPGTAQEGAKKVLKRLVPSYYWPRMKRGVQLQLVSCPTCEKIPHSFEKSKREAKPYFKERSRRHSCNRCVRRQSFAA